MNNKKQEYYSTRLKKLRVLPPPSFGIITQLIPLVSIGSSHLRLRDPQSRAAHIGRRIIKSALFVNHLTTDCSLLGNFAGFLRNNTTGSSLNVAISQRVGVGGAYGAVGAAGRLTPFDFVNYPVRNAGE